jgi:hypothetical protein
VCAAADTPIATPDGERAISTLAPGDLVYGARDGQLVPVPVLRVSSTPVSGHTLVRLTLASGRTLEMSAGHPTADGRPFDALRVGDAMDAEVIVAIDRVPYAGDHTWDILPASDDGTYVAAGVLVGSTLAARAD